MMKKIYMGLFIVLTFGTHSIAQDALFSQFFQNKNLLNPALLAVQSSPLEVDLSFREQAATVSEGLPIRTFQIAANFSNSSFEVDKISYGIAVLGDKGGRGHLSSNMIHGQFAYLKKLTGRYSKIGEHYLGIGTTLGLGQRSVSGNRFWFGNQFNTTDYLIDNSQNSGELGLDANQRGQSGLITDINLGLTWYGNVNEGLAIQAGFSAYHLGRANISILDGSIERQLMRWNAHASVSKSIYDNLNLIPQLVFVRQGVSHQFLFGSELEIDNLDDGEFVMRIGALGRVVNSARGSLFDSAILSMNIYYKQVKFGFGYDLTLSELSQFNNGRGAWEFNLGYTLRSKNRTGYHREQGRFRL